MDQTLDLSAENRVQIALFAVDTWVQIVSAFLVLPEDLLSPIFKNNISHAQIWTSSLIFEWLVKKEKERKKYHDITDMIIGQFNVYIVHESLHRCKSKISQNF